MIATSKPVKFIALVAAGGLHAAFALALYRDEPVLIEGAAGAQEAQIGTSFADMAAGTLAPEPVEDMTEEAEAEPVETTEAEEIEPETDTEVVEAEPEVTDTETAEVTETPAETAETVAQAEPVETAQPVEAEQPVEEAEQLAALVPVTPDGALTAVPEQTEPAPTEPPVLQAARPEPVETAPAPAPAETITAQTDDPISLSSKRPVMRDPAMETPIKRAEAPKPKPKPAPPKRVAQGNAEQNATAGSTSGSATAKAKTQGVANGRAKEAGNAAASNYPGLVNRKLARVRKPTLRNRGTARVAFSVSASGGLASLGIVQSSGSAQIDQAALRMVQRAAPFPKPPAGAQRNFSVPVQFR